MSVKGTALTCRGCFIPVSRKSTLQASIWWKMRPLLWALTLKSAEVRDLSLSACDTCKGFCVPNCRTIASHTVSVGVFEAPLRRTDALLSGWGPHSWGRTDQARVSSGIPNSGTGYALPTATAVRLCWRAITALRGPVDDQPFIAEDTNLFAVRPKSRSRTRHT